MDKEWDVTQVHMRVKVEERVRLAVLCMFLASTSKKSNNKMDYCILQVFSQPKT